MWRRSLGRSRATQPAAFVLALAVLMSACGGSADGDGGTVVASKAAPVPAESEASTSVESSQDDNLGAGDQNAPDAVTEDAETSVGTRSNPAPFGAIARIDDWEVSIIDVNKDAEDLVAAENMFNDPPEEGRSFVMWTVEATYVGNESGTAWIDLSWKLVGSGGNSFSSGSGDSCGVLPDDLDDGGETFPGGVVVGNVCVSAETAQIAGGTILVEGFFGESRTFFAIP